MTFISFRLTSYILLVVSGMLLMPFSAMAETSDKPKWYQVEIILFAHEPYGVSPTEHWRDDYNPLYPENTVILKPVNNQADSSATEVIRSASELPVQPNAATGIAGTPSLEVDEPVDTVISIDKDPYIILPSQEWQLNDELQRLKRSGEYRVLEHFAWRQPVSRREKSRPILVQGGNQYGLYFEVEGLITVSENRYLHVDSNLFFSKYTLDPYKNFIDWSTLRESPLMSANKVDTPPALSYQGLEPRTDKGAISFQGPNQQYRREYATPLKHIRRVRAGELHYLDHPLFGLLVKLTPYQLPDEAMDIIEFDTSTLPVRKPVPEAL